MWIMIPDDLLRCCHLVPTPGAPPICGRAIKQEMGWMTHQLKHVGPETLEDLCPRCLKRYYKEEYND